MGSTVVARGRRGPSMKGLEVLEGSRGTVLPPGSGFATGLLYIKEKHGGRCENESCPHGDNDSGVFYIRPMDMWLCRTCIREWDG